MIDILGQIGAGDPELRSLADELHRAICASSAPVINKLREDIVYARTSNPSQVLAAATLADLYMMEAITLVAGIAASLKVPRAEVRSVVFEASTQMLERVMDKMAMPKEKGQ